MPTDDRKMQILDFLKTQKLGVVSSLNAKGMPQSAVVSISETQDLGLIFGTFNDTRKYANIVKNSAVAFVIGWEAVTVQYEGEALVLSGEEAEKYKAIHLAKNPISKKFALDQRQRWFHVTPTWIRYTNLATDPEDIFEVEF